MSIELDEGILTMRDRSGPSLRYAAAMPSGTPKAVLSMMHGYAEHGARYAHVMGALAEHDIGSVIVDLRGHGRSAGSRGYCERFAEFLEDAREVRKLTEQRAKGVPHFLFGHSFGGLVATMSALDRSDSLHGVILSAPLFGLGFEPPRLKVLAGRLASRVAPKFRVPTGLSGKDMTHDGGRVHDYDADPLVFKSATARWFTETASAQERAFASAVRLRVPLYVVFGTGDRVASFVRGKHFFDSAGSEDKTWDPREGLLHEVLNEPSWKDIVEALARWTLARATTGALQRQ